MDAGWRVLKLAGIEPDGFVAPAYAYTPALRDALRAQVPLVGGPAACAPRATRRRDERQRAGCLAPAWSMRRRRPAAPRALAAARSAPARCCRGDTLRLDLHPADLQHPRHMLALEWVLARGAAHARRHRAAAPTEELAEPPNVAPARALSACARR